MILPSFQDGEMGSRDSRPAGFTMPSGDCRTIRLHVSRIQMSAILLVGLTLSRDAETNRLQSPPRYRTRWIFASDASSYSCRSGNRMPAAAEQESLRRFATICGAGSTGGRGAAPLGTAGETARGIKAQAIDPGRPFPQSLESCAWPAFPCASTRRNQTAVHDTGARCSATCVR